MNIDSVDLTPLLSPYFHRLKVGLVVIRPRAIVSAAATLGRVMPRGCWLVVSDPTTHRIAGERLDGDLTAAGYSVRSLILSPRAGEPVVVADDENVLAVENSLRAASPSVTGAVAVGSGTINDIVKRATAKVGMPYAVVATAPSMNGYTSPIAAILSAGVKTVQDARMPVAVVADVEILARSPPRMIMAGYGDLLSKPVSNADWLLSHRLTGSKYCGDVIRLVEEGSRLLAGVGRGLQTGDPAAVARLTGALILSGYAMALAGTSAPASGGEHLISHYLDMTHYALGEPGDLHGCQVGVGTLVSASLYERLFAWNPADLDIDERLSRLLPWADYEKRIRGQFGALADAVVPHAREWYPSAEELRGRLERVKAIWSGLVAELKPGMRSAAAIKADLERAGCPATFTAIGCDAERAHRALYLGKDIRSRYTILHLCWEIGCLDVWGEEVLAPLL